MYVRAEDARVIERRDGVPISEWVRRVVRDEIADFHVLRARALGAQNMPESWARRQADLEEGA